MQLFTVHLYNKNRAGHTIGADFQVFPKFNNGNMALILMILWVNQSLGCGEQVMSKS